MQILSIGRLRQWAIGVACLASLAACGAAERPAGAPDPTAAAAATTAPTAAIAGLPASTAVVAPTAGAAATAAATAPPTVLAPSLTVKETLMPERPSAQPQEPSQPTQQPILPASAPAEIAKADLARRRSVAPDTITIVEVRDVIWPDMGLGCPRPDMGYRQVQVDGLLIRLESGGQIFEYHSGGSKAPFLCEQPTSLGKPTPMSGGADR